MLRQFVIAVLFLLITVVCHTADVVAENWLQWRGPAFAGDVAGGDYPVSWTKDDNLAWKVELPGPGCSTPLVWEEQIVLTVPIDGKDGVLCLDLAGKEQWRASLGPERPGRHPNGSGCNPSPITDGKTIFVYFKSGTIAALDFEGNILWQKDLQKHFGDDTLFWDIGSSPVLTDDYVVGTVMHGGESGMVAYEKLTGKIAWKMARNYECPREGDHAYTTPIVMGQGKEQFILVWGAEHVTAHSAADGQLLWSCGGFNPDRRRNWLAVASAVVAGDVIVVPYGRGEHLAGVRLGGSGDVTGTHRLWTLHGLGSFVPTPAVHNGKVYVLGDMGEITCIDPDTGKTVWNGALPKGTKKYYASPTIAGGKVYAVREDGVAFVARIDGKFEVLSENPMGEKIIASPVPLSGRLLLRGEQHLFCVGSQ